MKDPCNRFRDAGDRRTAGEITWTELVAEGDLMFAAVFKVDSVLYYGTEELDPDPRNRMHVVNGDKE